MKVYSHIAQLFNYPGRDLRNVIEQLMIELKEYGKITENDLFTVTEHFTSKKISDLQEYYIHTFDVNATCYLDIGYVLFGEESKRGQFLLNMKREQLIAGNDCGTEFPDHLPNVLTLLPKIEDESFREELAVVILLPALKHMFENFRTDDNIYRTLIRILIKVIEANYKNTAFEPFRINPKEIESAGIYACGMDLTKLKNKKY